jgi:serine protease DegQ
MIGRIASAAGIALALVLLPAAGVERSPDPLVAQERDTTQPGSGWDRIPELVADVTPSVVTVVTGEGEGSGVIWSADGIIVTNRHVVADASSLRVVFADGRRVAAQVVADDQRSDLALLRVDRSGLPAADFADEVPEIGTLAIALGNPLGFENSVTVGVVSGVARSIPGGASRAPALVDLLQTDASISPGNSGGALVGPDGRVIGSNVAFIPPTLEAVSIGFAIPSPTVRDVVEQLLEDGDVTYAFLGAQLVTVTPTIAEQFGLDAAGVLVQDVVGSGPAATAGIEAGDVVVQVDGERVRTAEQLLSTLRGHSPGDELEVTVVRGGNRTTVDVTLGTAPE